jgi:thymidylate synthase
VRRYDLPDLRTGYVTLCDLLRHTGKLVAPRGQRTLEVEDAVITVEDLSDTLPIGVGRGVNLQFAALEALQLVSGLSTPELLVAVRPEFLKYLEADGSQHGAYGSRVHSQASNVVYKLRQDNDSRQAVITLWNPLIDNEPGHEDYPCTIALGFRVRKDKLNLSVTMRSNDAWLGVAYDVFQFTQLQHTVAAELGVAVGSYTHTAWSLHLYERDWAKVEELHEPSGVVHNLPHGISRTFARKLLTEPHTIGVFDGLEHQEGLLAPGDTWYVHQARKAWDAYYERNPL